MNTENMKIKGGEGGFEPLSSFSYNYFAALKPIKTQRRVRQGVMVDAETSPVQKPVFNL